MRPKIWFQPAAPLDAQEDEAPLAVKLLWFFGLMLAGVITVAGLAYTLRSLLFL